MLRLKKSDKQGDRFDFHLSNLQATQMKLECTSHNTKLIRRRDKARNNNITGSAVHQVNADSDHHHPDDEEEESISMESSLLPYSLESTESCFGRNSFSLHRNVNKSSSSITTFTSQVDSPSATNNSSSKYQLEDSTANELQGFHKELEEQVKFLKESNSNLCLQLKKTQHSNIDLLSVLQEMEQTIENQSHELECFKHKVQHLELENHQLVFKLKDMETNDFNVAAVDDDGKLESGVRDAQKVVCLLEREEKCGLELVKVSKLESEISSMELEFNQREVEAHLCEVEQENLRLSERICGLEAQLRYLTNEREATRSALHYSESRCSKLDHRVRELEGDVEKKANEIEKQVLEAKEECGYLRVAHQKMEATAEALMEECSSLEKSNLVLRRQKMELHQQCHLFEAELRESRRSFDNVSEEIQGLSEKLVSLSQETNLKERALNAELEALIIETTTRSNIHLLPLLQGSVDIPMSEDRLKDEVGELRQKQQVLMSDRERLVELVEDLKSKESKTKTRMRSLEMKLKACEFERKQLLEDVRRLKVELITSKAVERRVEEATFEKQRVDALLQVIKGDYERVKKEKELIGERMSRLEEELLKLEVCRNTKEVLEERLLRLEGDLTAKEALYSEEAQLKNELARVRRANNQLQRRLHHQEQQIAQVQPLQQQRKNSSSYCSSASSCIVEEEGEEEEGNHNSSADDNAGDLLKKKIELLEHQLAEALDSNQMYKQQLKSLVSSEGSMEKELRELRENYFNMSLKYALVEADREHLVMKLRSK